MNGEENGQSWFIQSAPQIISRKNVGKVMIAESITVNTNNDFFMLFVFLIIRILLKKVTIICCYNCANVLFLVLHYLSKESY